MGLKLAVIASSALALAAVTPRLRRVAPAGRRRVCRAWRALRLCAYGLGRPGPEGGGTAHRTERSYLRDAPVRGHHRSRSSRHGARSRGEPPSLSSPGFGGSGGATAGSARSSTRRSGACSPSREERGRAVRYLLRRQRPSGGWSWSPNGAPDSNDTAAAIQALRWSGVRGRPIRRGLAFIRNHTARNGGVRLVAGREPDAQSTAWAVQAYLAAGARRGCLPLPRLSPAAGRQLPLQPALRGHTGDRDGAGPPGAQPEAVSTALTQSGSGRHSRPSATRSSTSVLR